MGPDTYDPKAQQVEFQGAQKPTGILISPEDPVLMKPDIDRAIAQGIPVIAIDSDAPSSKRLLVHRDRQLQGGTDGGDVLAARV